MIRFHAVANDLSIVFYNYIFSFSLNYDKNMKFLITGFNLTLDNIPSNLQYIFHASSSEFISPRTEIGRVERANIEFANIKILFYSLLYSLFSEHKKFFNRNWNSLFCGLKSNADTRYMFQNKSEIRNEVISRSFQTSFSKDNNETKNYVLDKINNEVLYEDVLNLLKFLKSTLRHLN